MEKLNFPKTPGKHAFEPLYDASLMLKSARTLAQARNYKKAVFIYSNHLLSCFRDAYTLKSSKPLRDITNPNGIYEFGRDRKLLAYMGIGAPLTSVVAEELISVGINEIVIMGTAGGLDPSFRIGDMVLCTKALRDEGVSHHYLANSRYVEPDAELTERFEGIMKKGKIRFRKGPTWTIDAPYMETAKEVERYSKEGISTVEMEAAALFAVAKKRKVKAAAVFNISDLLRVEGWSGFLKQEKRHKDTYPKLARLAGMF